MKRNLLVIVVPVIMLVTVPFSLLYAQGQVSDMRLRFTPEVARVGEIMKISAAFTVTGGDVNLSATIEQTVPRYSGPPPPLIILGTFNPGSHVVDVYRYDVPTNPPERLCFNIQLTGGEFRNVCLKRVRAVDGGWNLQVASSGQWVGSAVVSSPVPSTEKPDLRIVGNLAVDEVVRIENIGRGTAYDVRARKECFVEGNWVRTGGDFGETRSLGPGQSVPVKIGKLGRSLGRCPSGTSKVRVVVDPGNWISETNENNNVLEASTLADLRIVRFVATARRNRRPGPMYTPQVKFTISNTGVGDAGPFVWEISILSGGEWRSFMGERISGLASGKQVTIERDAPSLGSRQQIRLQIDPFNTVPESDEADNRREATVPQL